MKILPFLSLLGLLLLTPSAWAGALERAAAISAFDEGQNLMEQGDVAAACAKFQESYDLDPQLGSLLHLANCREENGQVATAWGLFLSAEEWAEKQGDERRQLAEDRAAALAPQVSRIKLRFSGSLPQGATLTRDGVDIPPALWKRPIPIDQGEHTLAIAADGYAPWESTISVDAAGQTMAIDIPELTPLAQQDGAVSVEDSNGKAPRSLMARKWPAFVAAGVGVAGGVVWGIFGVQSMQAKSDADSQCGKGQPCLDGDTDLRKEAWDAGNIATIGAIVTGVGLATAGVLWFSLPGRDEKVTSAGFGPDPAHGPRWKVGVHLGGAQLEGHF